MPIAMPAAPYASAATSPRPSKKPPAAITGMSTASTTWGSSSVVGTGPVWPPPSPPCTITASTPHAATFSAWRRAPIDGTTHDAGVLQRLDLALVRRERERRDLHASRGSAASTRASASSASARRFTPNGRSVRAFTSRIAAASWS